MANSWTVGSFLPKTSMGLGALALGGLLGPLSLQGSGSKSAIVGLPLIGTKNPKVKRIVYLFQSGGPSQLDLFDYKPLLKEFHGQNLPDSIRKGQRLTGMSGSQTTFPMTSSIYNFKQYGSSQRWVSELMPYTAEIVDDLCFIQLDAYRSNQP